jgi:hypothetical protein
LFGFAEQAHIGEIGAVAPKHQINLDLPAQSIHSQRRSRWTIMAHSIMSHEVCSRGVRPQALKIRID